MKIPSRALSLVSASFAIFFSGACLAQSWTYVGIAGSHGEKKTGAMVLTKHDDTYQLSFEGLGKNPCAKSISKTVVENTDTTIIIKPEASMAGCEKDRYVVKKDGSGGVREVFNGSDWISDGQDHILSLQR